jgi:hypothetical protein
MDRGIEQPIKGRQAVAAGGLPWLVAAACIVASVALVGRQQAAAQGLYKCVDAGVLVYSDAPCISATRAARGVPGEKLTQDQVIALIQAMDRAAARMDWNAQAVYLADDVIIDVRIKSSRNPGRLTVNKAQYQRMVGEVKAKIRSYSLRREDIQVTLDAEGYRADVESKLTERWQDPGGAMIATSRERWLVEPRGGKPRIIMLDIITGEPKPQPQQQPPR